MLKLFDSLSFHEPMLAHSISKTACLKLTREKLIEIETKKWHDQLLSDGIDICNTQ